MEQNIRNQQKEYIPQLYKFAQIVVATNKNTVKYATTGTPKKFWNVWKEQDTAFLEEALARHVTDRTPTEQDRNLISLFSKERVMELIRYFVLFDANVKKICRYQQYFAIKEIIKTIQQSDEKGNRQSGVIWHTQGSGKSLTMVMLAKYILMELSDCNPKVVVVTDRKELDRQIDATFAHTRLNPARATSGRNLVELLNSGKADVVTTIINKFNTAEKMEHKNFSRDVFLLVDESHRSNYGLLATKMRAVFPNACYIGFTGTPLMKKEKNTMAKFGKLIHKYTIKDGVEDGAIVPLIYEGRFVEQNVDEANIDLWFKQTTKRLTEAQRDDLSRKWSSIRRLTSTDARIKRIALDINEHFIEGYKDTGFKAMANAIIYGLIKQDYIDSRGTLTEKFFTERRNGNLQFAPEVVGYEDSVLQILNSVYSDKAVTIEDARKNNIELQVDRDKLAMPQFKALWKRINAKSVYTVEFDSEELVRHCVEALDRHLNVRKIYFRVEEGEMNKIRSKEALESGEAFQRTDTGRYSAARRISVNSAVKYDLIGKLVEETGLTRHTVVQILTGIQKAVFDQFKDNPEEFILKAAQLINDEKATAIIQHITYHCLDDRYDTSIFTEPTIKGKLGDNAIKTKKHLYDYLVSDSQTERDFAQEMDAAHEVAVYVKLPGGFYISTPVGRYNPDWAIAFYEGTVKHIYFVAETKGTMQSMQLREIEKSKIHCAREHFRAISGGDVVYEVVDSYEALLGLMKR